MAITDWVLAERPREKLLLRGADSLSDAELLAIFLRVGIKGKTAVDLARELLSNFGSLHALLNADETQFCQGKGLGTAKYAQLQAVLEMARRYFVEEINHGEILNNPETTSTYLSMQLRGYDYEVFACLFLNAQHQVLAFEQLFKGSLNKSHIYPREIIKRVLFHQASAVIFAHNHPSGNNQPSVADKQITQTLQQALDLFEIKLLDHFIIGSGTPYSFAEQGLL